MPRSGFGIFTLIGKGGVNHAENTFIRDSRSHRGTDRSAVPAALHRCGVNQQERGDVQEKLLGVLLAAAAALLCAAMDYVIKQKEEHP